MAKDRILLFIPAYNCERQITRVLDQLTPEIMSYIEEVIVINNRSTDDTEGAVLRYKAGHSELNLKLFRNDDNYGLGGSQKVAFGYAADKGFDYVVMLHGDDQGNISDFLPVFKRGFYRYYDCVLGARFMLGSSLQGYSLIRTLGNIVYDFLFAAVIKQRVFDLGSGLNMYDVSMLRDGFYLRFPDNLMFNYCMIMALQYYNQTCRFYPISWRETDQVSNVKLGNQAVRVLKMLFDYADNPSSIRGEYREKEISKYSYEEIK
ncbi:MAG: glycosyltransferase family 2 protein [Lachnospiraceae bacterium]|nr:glycosyltransferase family 2 protein [Lachnospiraceae bacterium]